jgi:phytoene dehydrogenase-like protein
MKTKTVVVGGGLAGLTAAVFAARNGADVTVLEKAAQVGGRAQTTRKDGFAMNLGPRALYRGGAGIGVLRELGIEPAGRVPRAGGFAVVGDRFATLPAGFVSMATTSALSFAGKVELARLLASLPRLDTATRDGLSVSAWLEASLKSADAREAAGGFVRVANYAADFARTSAGVALEQLKRAVKEGVLYLDGGWQSVVDALHEEATKAGVRVLSKAKAERVRFTPDGAISGVALADGSTLEASAVVIAASPSIAAALAPELTALARFAQQAVPVEASCLDLALRTVDPRRAFALGFDRPLYASLHSTTARLAPEGGGLLHVLGYGGGVAEAELEALAERLQPGYSAHVVSRRYLPRMVVAHTHPAPDARGLGARPSVAVAEARGLFLAGDWVGDEGLLADASLASGKRAGALAGLAAASREAA